MCTWYSGGLIHQAKIPARDDATVVKGNQRRGEVCVGTV
jgi:hypothetical protein